MHDTTPASGADEATKKHRKRSETRLKYAFAPIPRGLIRDPKVSSDAVRLWGVLDDLWFQGIPPEIATLQASMARPRTRTNKGDGTCITTLEPLSRPMIFRLLNELESTGWLKWNRGEDDAHRFELLTGCAVEDLDHQALRRLRKLFLSGTPTVEEIRTILDETGESQHRDSESQHRDSIYYRDRSETLETASNTMPAHPPGDDGDDVLTPTELFLQEENLGVARELRAMPLDLARQYVYDARQRGASLPAIARGLRARWRREQTRQQQHALNNPARPAWIDESTWTTLPPDLCVALAGSALDDEGLSYYGQEATIRAYEVLVRGLISQARSDPLIEAAA